MTKTSHMAANEQAGQLSLPNVTRMNPDKEILGRGEGNQKYFHV